MCLKSPKPPEAPKVQPVPTRADVDTGNQRRKIEAQQGVFNNIFTSPLGDSTYGTNARKPKLATLGGSTARA